MNVSTVGILFSRGDNWKAMRRFTISTLRDFGMGKTSLEDKIHEECDALVDTFKSFKGLYICHYLLEYSWAPVGLP